MWQFYWWFFHWQAGWSWKSGHGKVFYGYRCSRLLTLDFIAKDIICSIGSIQNVALSFSDPNYAISVTALLFFVLPLGFTLFFGRTFCAGACPLGAIQDVVIMKPLSLPKWLNKTLGLIPIYICRWRYYLPLPAPILSSVATTRLWVFSAWTPSFTWWFWE